MTEENREDHHQRERLYERPASPDYGLLIADLEIPPQEEVQKLPALPQFCQAQIAPAVAGLDDDFRLRPATVSPGKNDSIGLVIHGRLAWTRRPPWPYRSRP